MIPTYTGLETALRGLTAAQAAMDVTSHNIANANTPGYSRQVADQTASTALTIPAFSNVDGAGVQVGTGVDVSQISRIRDQFLDIQYRAQNTATSSASTNSTILQQVQTALAEPGGNGLSTQLGKYWKAWSDLSNNPTSTAARQGVIDAGKTVAGTLNTIDQQLTTVQSQTAQQYATLTASPSGEVQNDANQIASLNTQISGATQAGQSPNDLLDQRDKLLDTLSGLAKVSVTTQTNGMIQVNFGDAAAPLVSGTTVNWPQSMTAAAGGQLGALQTLSNTTSGSVQAYRNALDSVTSQLASQVNALQPTSPFFSGSTAGTIAVAATASSLQTTTTGNAGANDLAVQLAGLNGGAPDQAYSAFVTQVGSDVQSVQSTQKTASSLLTAIDSQRQSTSGVSLDEEMTNLITFQRAYQASARVMGVMDSMLNTLITAVH